MRIDLGGLGRRRGAGERLVMFGYEERAGGKMKAGTEKIHEDRQTIVEALTANGK